MPADYPSLRSLCRWTVLIIVSSLALASETRANPLQMAGLVGMQCQYLTWPPLCCAASDHLLFWPSDSLLPQLLARIPLLAKLLGQFIFPGERLGFFAR